MTRYELIILILTQWQKGYDYRPIKIPDHLNDYILYNAKEVFAIPKQEYSDPIL